VDRVVGEQDRDVEPRLVHRDLLEVPDLHGVHQAEDPAHALAGVLVGDLAVGEQLHLLELLLEGHLGQEPVDPPLDPAIGCPRVGCKAASSRDCVAAITPPATIRLIATTVAASAVVRLRGPMTRPPRHP
jgi:hypothetical protein